MSYQKLFKSLYIDKRNNIAANGTPIIINARVVEIRSRYIKVISVKENIELYSTYQDITEFPNVNLNSLFVKGKIYKFLIKKNQKLTNRKMVSYKAIHPEQIRNKLRPIATASHYRNLYVFLWKNINNYWEKKGK